MDGAQRGHDVFAFGDYRLDARRRSLLRARDDSPVRIAPKAFDAVLHFVEHAGQLLTKRALLECLWPGLIVEENSLSQVVCEIRHALGESRGEHRYLATVPRRGYQFVAPVQCVAPEGPALTGSERRVLVLPFVDLNRRPADAFITIGLAEAVRHRLGQTRRVVVVAPDDSARSGEGAVLDYVVRGHMQHAGTRLRVMAQLLDVASGIQVWSTVVDGSCKDVFAVEDEVAVRVARACARASI